MGSSLDAESRLPGHFELLRSRVFGNRHSLKPHLGASAERRRARVGRVSDPLESGGLVTGQSTVLPADQAARLIVAQVVLAS